MSEVGAANLQKQLEEIYEQQFWSPCSSRGQLQQWIKTFLNIELPDYVVSEHSNSCPMDFVWDVYNAALTGNPDKTSFVVAASRNSMKTLSSAIVEFLMMVHFGRDIVHQAAILDQSLACIDYLDKFLMLPMVAKFFKSDSKRLKVIQNTPLNPHKKIGYAKLKVIVATKKSANAQRASVLVFDELDLIDKDILSESTFIADPDRTGKPPIFIYLSSRKSSVGPIQEKMDLANDPVNGISLHKWNVVDFLKPCPPTVHKPELPKSKMYIHRDTLMVRDELAYINIPPNMQAAYDMVEAYEGCLKCPIFIACRTRAVDQKGSSPSLRDVPFVASALREAGDPEKISAQLLNLKPESGGTVFNKFSRLIHKKNAEEAWFFAFGQYATDTYGKPRPVDKNELIKELRQNGWRFHCGVDFGWVDTAAAVLVAFQKNTEKIIIIHAEASPGFSNQDWLTYVKNRIYDQYGFDLLCPDTADKSSPTFAASLGMPSRNTKPAKIDTGVSWLRTRLWNASRQESQLVILDDPLNPALELLMQSFEKWQYLKTTMGFDFSQFQDDEWTHMLDCCRYAVDPFIPKHVATLSSVQSDNASRAGAVHVDTIQGMKELIKEHMFDQYGIIMKDAEEEKTINTAGGINISF